MLQIIDSAGFRKYYKENIALRFDTDVNTDFIDVFHPQSPENTTKGFANVIYGTRSRKSGVSGIAKFLRSISLKVASDVQSLYELLQNADDEGSDFVMIYFNEDYLICINNGNSFTKEDFSAIINVADNDKNEEDIGSFGIGFKILHRLVGKDDGEREIINNYAGPVIFSWNDVAQFELLQNGAPVSTQKGTSNDSAAPWLAKLIYTCFPTHPNETVYNKDYEPVVLFKEEELQALRSFLNQSIKLIPDFNSNKLDHGSLFFLKFGEGKATSIQNNIEDFRNSIENSLLFLKHVKKVYLQGKKIDISTAKTESRSIKRNTDPFREIDPEVNERDIEFTFGYQEDYRQSATFLQHPNLYNYFSLSEEVLSQRYILHCNAFDMHNDRRKLQPTSARNNRLLPHIAKELKAWILDLQQSNPSLFRNLYAALLLSEQPVTKNHIDTFFFQKFTDFLPSSIPLKKGFGQDATQVRIKKTLLDVQLPEFGHPHLQWLFWEGEEHRELLEAFSSKLNIAEWDLKDIVDCSTIVALNSFFTNKSIAEVTAFLKEISKDGAPRQSVTNKLTTDIEFIPFNVPDKGLMKMSLNQIKNNPSSLLCIGIVSKYKDDFAKAGFCVSAIDFEHDDFKHIKESLSKNYLTDKLLFDRIKASIEGDKEFTISEEIRKKLFNIIAADPSGSIFTGVAAATGDLLFFKNKKGELVKVRELADPALTLPGWLQFYQPEISGIEGKGFFISEGDVYNKLIVGKWDEIRKQVNEENCASFYTEVKDFFLKADEKNRLQLTSSFYLKTNLGWAKSIANYFYFKNHKIKTYNDFANVWSKVSEQHIPAASIIDFLEEEPFVTVEKPMLSECFLRASQPLENDELHLLFLFAAQGVANYLIILERGNTFWLTMPTVEVNYRQFRTDSSLGTLSKDIKLKLPFVLVPLPEEFAAYNKLYLSDDQLMSDIIEALKEDSDLLQLLQFRMSYDNYIKLLNKIKRIEVDCSVEIKSNSNLYYLFYYYSLYCDTTGFDRNLLMSRLILKEETKEWAVKGIVSGSNQFRFSESLSFLLSDLIPETYKLAGLLDSIKIKLKAIGLNENPVNEALGIRASEEALDKVNVFTQLSAELQDKVLVNSWQLSFVCHYLKLYQLTQCDFLVKVKGPAQHVSLLNQLVFTNSGSFTDTDRLLDTEVYTGDLKSIEVNEQTGYGIYKAPRINANGFLLAGVKKELTTEEDKASLLDFYFKKWKDNATAKAHQQNMPADGISSIMNLLDLKTSLLIYPDIYTLDEENVPAWLCRWIECEEPSKVQKEVFLSLLKVFTNPTPQVIFRRALNDKLPILSDTINALDYNFLKRSFTYIEKNAVRFDGRTNEFNAILARFQTLAKESSQPELELFAEPDFHILSLCEELYDQRYEIWKKVTQTDRQVFIYMGDALPEHAKSNFTGNHILCNVYEKSVLVVNLKVYVAQKQADNLNALFYKLKDVGFIDDALLESFLDIDIENKKEKGPESENIRLLREIYEEMQADAIDISPRLGFIIEAIIRGDIAADKQKAVNYSARILGFKFLKDKGYRTAGIRISDEFDKPLLENVYSGDDTLQTLPQTFIVRSAKGGLLYLNDFSWFDISKDNTQLLVQVDDGVEGIIHVKDQTELMNRFSSNDKALIFRIVKGKSFSINIISNILNQLESQGGEGHLILRTNENKVLKNLFQTIDNAPIQPDEDYTTSESDWR